MPPARSASWCSWRRWRSRCPSEGRSALRCSRQGHRNRGCHTGRAPSHRGCSQGSLGGGREELAVLCGGRGLPRGVSPAEALPGPRTGLRCHLSTLGPVHLAGASLGGSPGTQCQGQCMQEQWRSLWQGNPLPVEARGPIVPPSSIEKPMKCCYPQAAPPGAHRHLRLPGIGDRIIGLHCGQIRGPIIAVRSEKGGSVRGGEPGWQLRLQAAPTALELVRSPDSTACFGFLSSHLPFTQLPQGRVDPSTC